MLPANTAFVSDYYEREERIAGGSPRRWRWSWLIFIPALWPYYAVCVLFGLSFFGVAVYERAWLQAVAAVPLTMAAFAFAWIGRRKRRAR
ncbi:MAG: hypothetical protein QOD07_2350 [Frankiaceae bacterium]|nr:hypothetical protein [Frankiaceae bacterium]